METFSQVSPSFLKDVRPYDPENDRTFGEQLHRIGSGLLSLPSDIAATDNGWSRASSAAEEQMRAVDSVTASQRLREDWFAAATDRVKQLTGVDLTSPMLVAPPDLPFAASSSSPFGAMMIGAQMPPTAPAPDTREQDFFRRVGELARSHAELADITPEAMTADVASRARQADQGASTAWADPAINPWIKGAATTWGGLAGGVKAGDPVTIASLVLPAGGRGVTLVRRLASAMLTQAAVGAGAAAVAQPTVQAWRAEVGLPSGLGEAAANIGMGALFGAVGGGIVHGAGEAAGAGWRAAAAALRDRGVTVTPNMEQLLQSADAADVETARMRAARPESVPEHAGDSILRDGLATVDDPAAPLPLADAPIASGTTDDLAREALAGAPSLEDALATASATPDVLHSALASADPAIRDLGRIATLDPAIQRRVVEGELPAGQAAVVAATTTDPALQAAAVTAISDAKPATAAAARRIASDTVAAARARASSTAMQGADFGPRIDASPETFAAAFEEGRRLGAGEIVGALSHPDLGAIDAPIGNKRFGLVHIAGKHPEVDIGRLPEIIARSEIISRTSKRAELFDGQTRTSIRLKWEDKFGGNAIDKRWLVTAFEPTGRPEAVTGRAPDEAATGSFAAPADRNIRPAPSDIKDAVPMVRDDGTVALVSRADIERVADRERWMGEVISTCKV